MDCGHARSCSGAQHTSRRPALACGPTAASTKSPISAAITAINMTSCASVGSEWEGGNGKPTATPTQVLIHVLMQIQVQVQALALALALALVLVLVLVLVVVLVLVLELELCLVLNLLWEHLQKFVHINLIAVKHAAV